MTTQTINNTAHPSWCEPDRCEEVPGEDCIRHERVIGRVHLDREPITDSAGELLRSALKEPGAEVSLWTYAFDGRPAAGPLVSVVLPDVDGQPRCIDLTPDEARELRDRLSAAVGVL